MQIPQFIQKFSSLPPPLQPPHVFTIPSRVGHQTKDQLWLESSVGKGKICFACFNFQDKVYHQKCNLVASNPTSKNVQSQKSMQFSFAFAIKSYTNLVGQNRLRQRKKMTSSRGLISKLSPISCIVQAASRLPLPTVLRNFFFGLNRASNNTEKGAARDTGIVPALVHSDATNCAFAWQWFREKISLFILQKTKILRYIGFNIFEGSSLMFRILLHVPHLHLLIGTNLRQGLFE